MPRFVPRDRKHKKIASAKTSSNNTNTEVIVPESEQERQARRDVLRQQLRAHEPEKVSSKKRKRLDKYIETKLKKDENAELVRKLAKQQIDTSLLQSSKRLGRVNETQRERLSRALREKQAGISDGTELLRPRKLVEVKESKDESEIEGRTEEHDLREENGGDGVTVAHESNAPNTGYGIGLKRPLELDENGTPVIRKRRRRKLKNASIVQENVPMNEGHDLDEWHGFSSDEGNGASMVDDLAISGLSASQRSDDSDQSDDEGSESNSSSGVSSIADAKPRVSAFKAWADNLRNVALDYAPAIAPTNTANGATAMANFKPRQPSPDPFIPTATKLDGVIIAPAAGITIVRAEEIQTARLELPVVQDEQKIVEAINNHPVTVVCGATGSGKTTQIPQMLFENGYGSGIGSATTSHSSTEMPPQSKGMIGITQPRRVAATSVAARVQHELGPEYGKQVAHQVRYDSNVRNNTAMKFMTDGILLREIQNDFILSKYSVIVLDEAHERSVNTDILIGMLARIVPLRSRLMKETPGKYYPLKLVIMSATLSLGVDSFLQNDKLWRPLGGPPPVVSVEGRQYPVTVHFARKTGRDYVKEVVEKVVRGHRKLPPGGMLVFLTGQQEIQTVMSKLRDKIDGAGPVNGTTGDHSDDEEGFGIGRQQTNGYLEEENSNPDSDSDAEIKLDEETEFDIQPNFDQPQTSKNGILKPYILPLYAALPPVQQLRVFQQPPPGTRLIVLATNVAETSLTIPGMRYVIDSGRAKEKHYNTQTGVQTFEVGLISKASAEQRKGRAGRTASGHVWRLYSSNVYEEWFAEETVPEILRTGLESVVLQLKSMDIKNVATFPFPTAPDEAALKKAETLLRNLGAVGEKTVTDIGREIMRFPVNPRFGHILLLAQTNSVVPHATALVAGLAVGDLFIPPQMHGAPKNTKHDEWDSPSSRSGEEDRRRKADEITANERHQRYTRSQATLSKWDDKSDAIKLLIAVLAHADPECNNGNRNTFCKDYWLREKGMTEVQLLRRQLHSIITNHSASSHPIPPFVETLPPPTEKQFSLLKQLVAAGFVDQVAIRSDLLPNYISSFTSKPGSALEVPYRTLLHTTDEKPADWSTLLPHEQEIHNSVFIHPSSALARLSAAEMPPYLIYSHLSRAASSTVGSGVKVKKTRIHPLTPVTAKTLAVLAENTPLLQIGKPIGKIEDLPGSLEPVGGYDVLIPRRQCWISVSLKAPGGDAQEWPLGAWKVVQRRVGGRWEVEKMVAR